MKKFFEVSKKRKSLFLASAFAPAFGMLIGAGGSSGPQSPTRSDIKIVNKTKTLEVVARKSTVYGTSIIRFKNISSRDLNGYAVMVDGARITGDISSGDRVVSPGETEDLEIPASLPASEVTVLAAMFADGSIEGDPAIALELREWRLALKKQLTRSISALDATLGSPDVDDEKALDRLESQFSSLDPASAIESRIAGDTLNTEILTLRENLQRQGAGTQRQNLKDLKGRIQRRIARL